MSSRRPLPYDPRWPVLFEEEAAVLRETLAPWVVGDVHHVGSTSIRGMAAKPVIDMIAGVRDLEGARDAFEPLGRLGYGRVEHRKDAHAFHKPPDAPTQWEHTHHLHLTVPGSDLWRERLAFRDALRGDPCLVREYTEWKLAQYGRPTSPPASKRPFVARVLAAQGVVLKPDEERLTEAALARRRS
ncbi:MAG TPA: GrpB family protein [Gaiellaceae bacterium]|nr:GrpB family protein [Gaiellaceae bacterium]